MAKAVYIHIPFCASICTYCDFAKVLKNEKWIDAYLKALKQEIKINYQGEIINTLYIGGGTPSTLSLQQLETLFNILKIFKLSKNVEITLEANVEDLTQEKLEFLKNKINRLSIGVQSFDDKILKLLGRKRVDKSNLILAKKYFNNINVDLMYGFNEENLDILKEDINMLLNLDIPHISTYSLILEPHTKLYIDNYQLLDDSTENERYIEKTLTKHGYIHYEISNYAKKDFASKHNLTYWNNDNYYGFGLGSSGYLKDERYENENNLMKYLNGTFIKEKHKLTKLETIQNEFILGFRKLKGINKNIFKDKYGLDIKDIKVIDELLKQSFLKENNNYIFINHKYLYLSNEILVKFLDNDLLK